MTPSIVREPDEKPDKGLKGGSCNRRACQAPGAMWFNHYTDKYYCRSCAHLINRGNPEGWPIGSRNPAVVLDEWTRKDSELAVTEGWDLFDIDCTGVLKVQRHDESEKLATDFAAWLRVGIAASKGSTLHAKALRLMPPDERERIQTITASALRMENEA